MEIAEKDNLAEKAEVLRIGENKGKVKAAFMTRNYCNSADQTS